MIEIFFCLCSKWYLENNFENELLKLDFSTKRGLVKLLVSTDT